MRYDTLQVRNNILFFIMTNDMRKAHIVMATDSEWQIIGERAKTARMSISRFMVECALVRYQHAGDTETWEEIVAAADVAIKAEEADVILLTDATINKFYTRFQRKVPRGSKSGQFG